MPGQNKKPRPKKQHDLRAATLARLADGLEKAAADAGFGPQVYGVEPTTPAEIVKAAVARSLEIQAKVFRTEAKRARRLR